MLPLSCVNCSFNALQSDSVGLSTGYCTEHRRVLLKPEATTCGRLFRKDLVFLAAEREQLRQERVFSPAAISSLATRKLVNGAYSSNTPSDLAMLEKHPVAAVVAQYGDLGAKIESLAQLKEIPGTIAELGLVSLGRTYVRRCVQRNGVWTSGVHLFWWTKERVAKEPDIGIDDLRESMALPLSRQIDLAKWSIVMLRLTFLSDVGQHASGTKAGVKKARNLAEEAAVATGDLSFSKLMRWVKNHGQRILEQALPKREYERISRELHKEDP